MKDNAKNKIITNIPAGRTADKLKYLMKESESIINDITTDHLIVKAMSNIPLFDAAATHLDLFDEFCLFIVHCYYKLGFGFELLFTVLISKERRRF